MTERVNAPPPLTNWLTSVELGEVLQTLEQLPPVAAYALLAAGAFLEYLVPPLPGDTVVVAGSVLVAAFGWSMIGVFSVVTAASVLGSAVDYAAGAWIRKKGAADRLSEKTRKGIDLVAERFEKHGVWYLAVNRFLPGVRAFFFVGAGYVRLPIGKVLLWSALSAAAWNGMLVGIGYAVGDNLEQLEQVLGQYSIAMWIVIGVVMIGVFAWVRRAVSTSE